MGVPGTNLIRVLLADDDPGFLDALATALEADGRFEIAGRAGNGIEAFELGCRLDPDVVVLDVNMPQLGGIEAARRLERSRPQTRVLLVSSEAAEVSPHCAVDGVLILPKLDLDDVIESAARLAAERPG
jgi:DNA-binding NarL/FixJ family response regulator